MRAVSRKRTKEAVENLQNKMAVISISNLLAFFIGFCVLMVLFTKGKRKT